MAVESKYYSEGDIVPMTDEEKIERWGSMEAFLDAAFRHQQCGLGAHVCSRCGNLLSHRSQLESMLCSACQEKDGRPVRADAQNQTPAGAYDGVSRMDFTLTDGKIGYRRITLERRGDGRFDRWFGPAFSYERHEPSGPLTLRQSGSLIAALEDADPLSWKDVSRRLTHLGGIEWGFSFTLADGATFCKIGENDFPDSFESLLDEMIALGLPMPKDKDEGF